MSEDVIWALDQRERCIACPSKPVANAVVLHLAEDGSLARGAVEQWARDGVMAAGAVWPGITATSSSAPGVTAADDASATSGGVRDLGLSDDDWLDLEDCVTGLAGLASVVAVVGDGAAAAIADELARRVGDVSHAGAADRPLVLARLQEIAPVAAQS